MHSTGISLKQRFPSGVTQYGLKPVNTYDFKQPGMLVNYGRSTNMGEINIRRSDPGKVGSAISFDGASVGGQLAHFTGMTGDKHNVYQITFCRAESTALRICMAKGQSNCETENRFLSACLGRVMPVKREAREMNERFADWFRANVSDNFTKPLTHRTQDWKHVRAQEELVKRNAMHGRGARKYPKPIPWGSHFWAEPGFAKRSRMPVNK